MTAKFSEKDFLLIFKSIIFYNFIEKKIGVIILKDLRKVSKELGETMDVSELQELIDRSDSDGVAYVILQDFYNIMIKKKLA